MTPAGKQDICRTRTGVWNKAGGFSPGTKSSSLGSGENHITKRDSRIARFARDMVNARNVPNGLGLWLKRVVLVEMGECA